MAPTQLVTQALFTHQSCCVELAFDHADLPLFPREFFGMGACDFYHIGDEEVTDEEEFLLAGEFYHIGDEETDEEESLLVAEAVGAVDEEAFLRSRASSSMCSWHECGDFPT